MSRKSDKLLQFYKENRETSITLVGDSHFLFLHDNLLSSKAKKNSTNNGEASVQSRNEISTLTVKHVTTVISSLF